ncbi:hypothetical protein FSP39_012524 [Pinctada imbricata]|uniref:C1q domain-containing protein n=1 Tax=Pinctada imbricata TaxID=66713 RepID=A0AA88XWI9_PINIB|nr:hypothetical protein FSP39_012524 [Pinctada imbricata]
MSRGLPVATPVAFYAYMTHIMTSVGEHHQLVFDVVKTNIGDGYHQSGVFIVPESGIYVFTLSFRVHNEGYHAVELDVNGNRMGVAYSLAHNNVSDQTSATIVISVKKGDDVYLRTGNHNNKGEINTDSYGYTYFAGWKI